jgi:hypothetical protein
MTGKEAFAEFTKMKEEMEKETDKSMVVVESDGGSNFLSNEFQEGLNGTKFKQSIPGSSEQVSDAEVSHKLLMNIARCLLYQHSINSYDWPYAIDQAVLIYNNTVTKGTRRACEILDLESKISTPMKIYGGKEINLSTETVSFGCLGVVHVPHKVGDKFQS